MIYLTGAWHYRRSERSLSRIYIRAASFSEEWSGVHRGESVEEEHSRLRQKVGDLLTPTNMAPALRATA